LRETVEEVTMSFLPRSLLPNLPHGGGLFENAASL
jgi:hypothetical protein